MVLDECIETPAPRDHAEAAVARTPRGLDALRKLFSGNARNATATCRNGNSELFIAHFFPTCPGKAPVNFSTSIFPGYAVGGLAVGEPHETTGEMTAEVTALLQKIRPRISWARPPRTNRRLRRPCIDIWTASSPREPRAMPASTQRRPRAHQERRLCAGPAAHRSDCTASAAATRAPICVIFFLPENSPPRSSATHHNVHFYLDIMRQIREAIELGT